MSFCLDTQTMRNTHKRVSVNSIPLFLQFFISVYYLFNIMNAYQWESRKTCDNQDTRLCAHVCVYVFYDHEVAGHERQQLILFGDVQLESIKLKMRVFCLSTFFLLIFFFFFFLLEKYETTPCLIVSVGEISL